MQRINVNAGTSKDEMGWAFIGYGQVAVAHMEGLMANHYRLAGFSTSNERIRSGDATGLTFNIGPTPGRLFEVDDMFVTDDYRQLLCRDDVQAVVVCAPTSAHLQVALDVAAAGKHCLMEKPIATSYAEGRKMLDAFRASGCKLAVGQVLPSFPEFYLLYRRLLVKGMRNVRSLEMRRWVAASSTDDREKTTKVGGYAADLGVHDFHLLRCCEAPTAVRVRGWTERYSQVQRAQVAVEFEGAKGNFNVDVGAFGEEGFQHSYAVNFLDDTSLVYDGSKVTENGVVVDMPSKSVARIFGDEQVLAKKYFQGMRSLPDYLDALAALDTLKIIEAVDLSARSGISIAL